MVFLPLHAPILEPDFDLSFGQRQRVRNLDAPSSREVAIEVELLLQFEYLMTRVGGARSLVVAVGSAVHCV